MSNTECNMLLLKLYDIIISFCIVFWGKKGGGTVHIMKHTRCCMTYWYLLLKFIIGCHRSVMITILAIVSAWIKKWGKYLCDCKYFFFNFDVFSSWIKQEMELYTIEYEEFLSLDPSCSSKTIFVWPSKGQGDFWAWEPLEKTLKVNTTLFVRWQEFPSLQILFIVLLFLFIERGI